MKISLEQAASILNKSKDEVLFVVQDKRLHAEIKQDGDMVFNDDGTVRFIEDADPGVNWEFELDDVLKFKEELDADLDGTLKNILES